MGVIICVLSKEWMVVVWSRFQMVSKTCVHCPYASWRVVAFGKSIRSKVLLRRTALPAYRFFLSGSGVVWWIKVVCWSCFSGTGSVLDILASWLVSCGVSVSSLFRFPVYRDTGSVSIGIGGCSPPGLKSGVYAAAIVKVGCPTVVRYVDRSRAVGVGCVQPVL